MRHFFFDLNDDGSLRVDKFGEVLENVEEARSQCQSLLPEILREKSPRGDARTLICNVRDDTGRIVYRGEVTYRGEQVSE